MNVTLAFLAGVIGGTVMSVALAIGRALGIPADFEHTLGTMFLPPGVSAFVVGYVAHLLIAGAIGIIYGWAFENLTHRAGTREGAAFGLVHAAVAGTLMAGLPAIHPLIPEALRGVGPFMSNFGIMGIVGDFVVHTMYGATVGAIYVRQHVPPVVRS